MIKINSRYERQISDEQRIRIILEDRTKFVKIPEEDILIGDKKPLILTPFSVIVHSNWEEFHKFLLMGYNMGIPSMVDGLNLILLLLSSKPVYDGNGNKISSERRMEILHYKLSETCEYYSTQFTRKKDKGMMVNHNYKMDREHNLVPQSSQLIGKSVLLEDCFVDLMPESFNLQGLPIKKSKTQTYEMGKRIKYYRPINNSVARLSANANGTNIKCGRNQNSSNDRLGVCAKVLEV